MFRKLVEPKGTHLTIELQDSLRVQICVDERFVGSLVPMPGKDASAFLLYLALEVPECSEKAIFENVKITSGTLQISSECYFGTDDYIIGLLCGMGTAPIDYSAITCVPVGNAPENVVITVDGNSVEVAFN
jgi:hypothetical protein